MKKKILSLFIFFAIIFTPIYALLASPMQFVGLFTGEVELESFLAENMPFSDQMRSGADAIKRLAGAKEIDGIFYVGGGLIENYKPSEESFLDENLDAINNFSQIGVPTYCMLIPTSCAILQEQVPTFAPLFNQKSAYEQSYEKLAGNATTIDVYPVLFAHADEYLYYRTENNLTSLAGKYIYQTAANRMYISPKDFQDFTTRYADHSYVGSLGQRWQLEDVTPDILTLYDTVETSAAYTVQHITPEGIRSYNTLYPTHLSEIDDPYKIFLGGISGYMKIYSSTANYSENLLIFGDETAASYLPFFAASYKNITFIRPDMISKSLLSDIDPQEFDQVLYAFSLANFMDKPVCAGTDKLIKPEDEDEQ